MKTIILTDEEFDKLIDMLGDACGALYNESTTRSTWKQEVDEAYAFRGLIEMKGEE